MRVGFAAAMRRTLGAMLPAFGVAALSAAGCIPDLGPPGDAGGERPTLPPDAAPGEATPGPDGPGAEKAPGDAPVVTCGTPNRDLMLAGMNDLYVPALLTASVGDCVRLCIENQDVHPHVNSSDESLFDDFTTNASDRICVVFKKTLSAGPHGLTCLNHPALMKAKIVAE